MAVRVNLRGGWLAPAIVAFTATALVLFTALNPDAFIARRNVAGYASTGLLDVVTLRS